MFDGIAVARIIITGSSGFLGRNLIRALTNNHCDKYEVYALTSNPSSLESIGHKGRIHILGRDSLFTNGASSLIEHSIVVNCAFPRNAAATSFATGLNYVHRCFESAKEGNAAAVINISSQSVYSQQRSYIADENSPIAPESTYAVGKYATEIFLSDICKGMPFTNLRMSSLIGAGFDQRVTNRMISQVIETHHMRISKSAKKFGFMDVCDAAQGICALIETPLEEWRAVYTLGTGLAYGLDSLSEVVSDIADELLGYRPDITVSEDNGTGNTSVSGELFCKDTGFACQISIEESIRRIFSSKISLDS